MFVPITLKKDKFGNKGRVYLICLLNRQITQPEGQELPSLNENGAKYQNFEPNESPITHDLFQQIFKRVFSEVDINANFIT